jgi:RimJ/RimL family protein N-acetyltransferase
VTEIRTERLLLRTLTRDEAAAVVAGDRTGRAWAEDYPSEGDLVVAGIACEAGEHYDESAPYSVLQVRLLGSGAAIGGIGFISAPEPDGSAEVGYGLAESARGSGFATEALEGVATWATDQGLRVLVALTTPDNLASQRVLERTGFVRGELVQVEDGQMIRWQRRLQP